MFTLTAYGADAVTFRLNFQKQGLLWFFQSLAVDYTLPGILVRQRANVRGCTDLRLCCAAFRILSVTLSLINACAFSKACARAIAL